MTINTSLRTKIAIITLGAIFVITLLFSSAIPVKAALTTAQIDAIISLLQSFGADQETINNVQVSLTGGTPPTLISSCPVLKYNLYFGIDDNESNGEVTKLQKFLAQDSSVYPEGEITGYYGPMSERAVKKWQSKNGVVSSGTPDTTGFGAVGPKTREAIKVSCGGTVVLPPPSPTPSINLPPTASGVSGPIVLNIGQTGTWTVKVSDPENGVLSYGVVWGDGITGYEKQNVSVASVGQTVTFTHSYSQSGVYTPVFTVTDNAGLQAKTSISVNVGGVSQQAGELHVSKDSSSPSYGIVAGGSDNVTVNVLKFTATDEPISLKRITLQLDGKGSSSNHVEQVTIWDGFTQVGTAVFIGNNKTATSIFSNPVIIPKNSSKSLTIKADIASIGISQTGRSGAFIQINHDGDDSIGTYGVGTESGITIYTSSNDTTSDGIRIMKSFPVFSKLSVPSTVLVNGSNVLYRFKVSADSAGGIGIAKFTSKIIKTGTIDISSVNMYAYTDSSFTTPVAGLLSGGKFLSNGVVWSSSEIDFRPNDTLGKDISIQIPAGATRYFEVRGTVSSYQSGASISTQIEGDINTRSDMQTGFIINSDSDNDFISFTWRAVD